jgi:hypothetical protein
MCAFPCLHQLILLTLYVQVVTNEADVHAVFRSNKFLQFEPIVEWGLGIIFTLSTNGARALRHDMNGEGDTLLSSSHAFYGSALKEGPELQQLGQNFCHELYELLDKLDEQVGDGTKEVELRDWSRTLLGTAATNATLGPGMLERICPDLLTYLWQFEVDLFKFVFGLPRWVISKEYKNREKMVDAFEEYAKDPRSKDGAIPMFLTREPGLRTIGMSERDIGICHLSIWSA